MKNPALFFLLLAGLTINAFAGTPHTVYGRIFNSDGSVPAENDLEFEAHISDRPQEILMQDDTGAGYADGYWFLNSGNFATDWQVGDTLAIDFINRSMQENASIRVVLTPSDPDSVQPVYLQPFITYKLQLGVSPAGAGHIAPAAGEYDYPEQSIVNLSAVAHFPYRFIGWSGEVIDTDSSHIQVIMDRDRSVTAGFELITYDLQLLAEPEDAANFVVTPQKETYVSGDTVVVKAIGKHGYIFDYWSGSVGLSDSVITVIMDSPKTLVAHFFQVDKKPPALQNCYPAHGSTHIPTNCKIYFSVNDPTSGVDFNSIDFFINDLLVYSKGKIRISGDLQVKQIDSLYSFMYRKKFDFARQESLTVRIAASDLATQPNSADTVFAFKTGNNRIYPRVGKRIGKGGAELKDWNTKIKMVVPAGALDDSVFIDINVADNIPLLPDSVVQLGELFYLNPGGLEFNLPVTVHIPFRREDFDAIADDPSKNLFALLFSPHKGYWQGLAIQERIENFVPVRINECGYLTLAVRPAEVIDPLQKPHGHPHPVVGLPYLYDVSSTQSSHQGEIEYRFEWEPGSFSPWSQDTTAVHVFNKAGQYNIRAFARSKSDTSKRVASDVFVAQAFQLPAPAGDKVLLRNMPYSFHLDLDQQQGQHLQFQYDWGNGQTSAWTEEKRAVNSWINKGDYTVRVNCKSLYDTSRTIASDSLTVRIVDPGPIEGNRIVLVENDYPYRILQSGYSAPLNELEYVVFWGDSSRSKWSRALVLTHRWQHSGVYRVYYKVRDRIDTTRTVTSDSIAVNAESVVLQTKQTELLRGFPGLFKIRTLMRSEQQAFEYRYVWGDGTVSPWTDDSSKVHVWNRNGAYTIKGQTRFKSDSAKVSETSPLTVVVRSIPAPKGPQKRFVDQSARFTLSALTGFSQSLSYRFLWGDGVMDAWSNDTTSTHVYKEPGTFPVWVQARMMPGGYISASDTAYVQVSFAAGVEQNKSIQSFALFPNFPNPFNPATTIQYQLAEPAFTRILIYNINGQHISTLVNQRQSAGIHKVNWNGKDDTGKTLCNGIYIARMKAADFEKSIKMFILH